MIGKIVKGSCFKTLVNYALGKKDAHIIDSEGVLLGSNEAIASSFVTQAQMKAGVKQPVEHIILSYKKEDEPLLTDDKMAELAREYMHKMGLANTQYLVVRHHDRDHPHCHIVLNRVGNDGRLLSDKNDKLRNMTVCREMKIKHGLTFGENKANVNLKRLRGSERVKHEIYHALTAALKSARNWHELRGALARQDITMEYKFKGRTDEVQGINFTKDGFTFRGSQIDRGYSYSKLDARLKQNQRQAEVMKQRSEGHPSPGASTSAPRRHEEQSTGITDLFDFNTHTPPEHVETLSEAEARRRREQKKKRQLSFHH